MSDMRRKECQKCYTQYIAIRPLNTPFEEGKSPTAEQERYYALQQCQFSRIRPDTAICKLVRETCFPKDYVAEVKKELQVQKLG